MQLFDEIQRIVHDMGSQVGVTDLEPFDGVAETMAQRTIDGTRGTLHFTYQDISVATNPLDSFPWGRSILVVASPYLGDGDGRSPGRAVARFAHQDRYKILSEVLDSVAATISAQGFRAEIVFDDDRLIDRAVAQRAGVGWSGKSTMILVPGVGPWVLLGSVVTDAPIPTGTSMSRTCGTCDACMPACPTGAIIAPGVLDARLCLSAILQARNDIPFAMRPYVGGRIYGCDDCLTSCPPGDRYLDSVRAIDDEFTPRGILSMTDKQLMGVTAHWYVPGRQMKYVRRNALVALGNIGTEKDIGILCGYAGHPNAMLRRYALWSLHAIAPHVFASVARTVALHDPDVRVQEDLTTIASGEPVTFTF